MLFSTYTPSLSPDSQRALAQSLLDGANAQESIEEQIAEATAKINEGVKTLKRLKVVR